MREINLPEEVRNEISGKELDKVKAKVEYKNWKGEVGIRNIIPLEIFYGSTEYHKEEQWLLRVWDLDKKDYRTYAVKDISRWL